MNIFLSPIRWIYYGQNESPSKIFRTNFDGIDKRVIINNLPASVFGIGLDVDVQRLYWMEYTTGDLKSAWFNGSDVKTIVSTNAKNKNFDIDIDGDFIFYTSNNKIMKINKSLGQNPTVVHTDTQQIYGVLLCRQDGYTIAAVLNSKCVVIQLVLQLQKQASNGWLESWRSKFSIGFFKVCGESVDVDQSVVDDFKSKLENIVADYTPENVFNADETGLFFKALPDKTLGQKGEACKGGKLAKERITVMLACSSTGEKLPPSVIGKAKKPRCFKNINVNNL
ncbi:unnamed protein product [Mytilus coruscus]|uniref:DDE-1 domain-containing protein n=1 Tax=Mytilus coruscus TaxID=42192 RepID=A0A6J8CJ56_MYTCO|nr:unnamed protein product [Mytilus coruscus]